MKFYEAISQLNIENQIRRPRWGSEFYIRLGSDYDLLAFYDNTSHSLEEGDIDFDDVLSNDWVVESRARRVPTVEESTIDSIFKQTEFTVDTLYGNTTVVSAKLPNGFVITESSGAVSPENYSEQTGVEICEERIKNKIWELEGYKLASEVAGGSYDSRDGVDFSSIFATHPVYGHIEG